MVLSRCISIRRANWRGEILAAWRSAARASSGPRIRSVGMSASFCSVEAGRVVGRESEAKAERVRRYSMSQ